MNQRRFPSASRTLQRLMLVATLLNVAANLGIATSAQLIGRQPPSTALAERQAEARTALARISPDTRVSARLIR